MDIENNLKITLNKDEERRILSRAIEQSAAIIMMTDKKGNIEYINSKFTEVMGYTTEEIIGKPANALRSDKTPPEIFNAMRQTILTGKEWKGELSNIKKNGDHIDIFLSVSPIRNEHGIITHFLSVQEDITLKKKAEEKLLESYKYLAVIHRQISILLEVAKESSKHTTKKIYEYVVQAAMELAHSKVGALYYFDKIKNSFVYISSSGINEPHIKLIHDISANKSPILKKIINKRCRMQFTCLNENFDSVPLLNRYNIKYILILPILIDSELKGELILGFSDRTEISTRELDMYELLAIQLSYILSRVLK